MVFLNDFPLFLSECAALNYVVIYLFCLFNTVCKRVYNVYRMLIIQSITVLMLSVNVTRQGRRKELFQGGGGVVVNIILKKVLFALSSLTL